jgi:hypothetical protein
MKPLIYIAGPYSHPDPVLNVREACLVADQVVAMGAAVVVPHLSMLWHTISPQPIDVWYARDLDLLDHCHAVVLLPGESKGADAEVAYARARDIRVFSTDHPVAMRLLRRFIEEWRP